MQRVLNTFWEAAACSRCCWCGQTDVEGWCHVTNWEIIYRVKKTSEQEPESLGNAHLDGRTAHPQQGTQGKGTVFSESCFGIALMWGGGGGEGGEATRHAVKHGVGYFQSKNDWSSLRSGGPLSGAPVASLVLSCVASWSTSLSKFAAKHTPRLGSELAC